MASAHEPNTSVTSGIDIDPDVLIWGGPAPADGRTPPLTLKVAIPA